MHINHAFDQHIGRQIHIIHILCNFVARCGIQRLRVGWCAAARTSAKVGKYAARPLLQNGSCSREEEDIVVWVG